MRLELENSTLDFSYSLHHIFFQLQTLEIQVVNHEMISKSEVNSKKKVSGLVHRIDSEGVFPLVP